LKVLIWDFDVTLAAREGMWTATLVAVANRLMPGRAVTRDQIRPFLQTGFPWHTPERTHPHQTPDEWWAALKPVFAGAFVGTGIDAVTADELAGQVRAAFLDIACWHVYDDVKPSLSSLQQHGWTHCILSNHVPELPDLAEALGLSPFFTHVVTSARTGYEKPHPEAFKGLLRQFPVGTTAWMIGDSVTADVQGAEAVGMRAVLVRKKQDGARHYCGALAELEAVLSCPAA